jgi:hypothetical protein
VKRLGVVNVIQDNQRSVMWPLWLFWMRTGPDTPIVILASTTWTTTYNTENTDEHGPDL